MVLRYEKHEDRIVVHVDPDRPGAWRREPFYSEIKSWAIAAAQHQGQVIVWQGPNAIAVLPDRETNLGPVRQGQLIIYAERTGPFGPEIEAIVVDRDHPWAAKFVAKQRGE
jgi:hypothetical protein